MDLQAYLDDNKLTQRALALRAGVDESKLSRILRGELRVMPEIALALHEATGREVSLEAILKLSVKGKAA